jgi:tetratricopeptide (TPR) repeat protein
MIDSTHYHTTARPGAFRVVIALVALAALAASGAVIWVFLKKEGVTHLPAAPSAVMVPAASGESKKTVVTTSAMVAPAAANRPIADDEAAFWSDVAIYKAGSSRPRPIVVVTRGNQPMEPGPPNLYQGLLAREVVRQGLLLAAREELGAVTRDVPIGDPEVSGKPDATYRIGSRFRTLYMATPDDPAVGRITIVQGDGSARRVVWSSEFDCGMNIAPTYPRLVMFVERFSREDFPKAMESLGLSRSGPSRPKNAAEGTLPPGVLERLDRLVETEAFTAIRALHEAIRTQGETSALLIALARAYANLGSLAESQWTPDYLAFHARALLYAQRAVVRDHDAPPSLRGQAYVEALAGLPRQALDDLDGADKADGGKTSPPWAESIRAFSHSDATALDKLVAARLDDPLPRYLRFLTRRLSSGIFTLNGSYEAGRGTFADKFCRHEIIAAGRALLEKVPDCFRVHDGMASVEGVSNLHASTSLPLEIYPKAVPKRASAIPDLPQSAARRVRDGAFDEVGLRKELVAAAADDTSDLTWGVLARQLREIRFVLVCRRLHFLAYSLATDYTDFAAESLPLVADHPHKAYIECAVEGFSDADVREKLRSLELTDFEAKAHDIFVPLRNLVPDFAVKVEKIGWEHTNLGTLPGQVQRTKVVNEDHRWSPAHNLLRFDPESPLGRAALVESKWEEAQPQAAAWEKDHGGGDTSVIAELGFRALKDGKLDDAERRLEKALARSPDRWIFDGLVEVYRKTDRVDRWKKAVDQFVAGEDQNLDHAHVSLDLARYLMDKGRYAEAWPYAERAASSWAGWAMPWASYCAEKLNYWESAELWISRTSQRYSISWLDWFSWCQRTGRGDARSAAKLVEAQVDAGRQPSSGEEARRVALVYLLDGQPDVAKRLLEDVYKEMHDTVTGVWLAWACDVAGDAKARDAALKAVADDKKPAGPKTARVVGVLADWMAKGEKTTPALKRIDAILAEIDPEALPNTAAAVGLFVDHHGKHNDAERYLKQADTKTCHLWLRYLVRSARRARGVALDPIAL